MARGTRWLLLVTLPIAVVAVGFYIAVQTAAQPTYPTIPLPDLDELEACSPEAFAVRDPDYYACINNEGRLVEFVGSCGYDRTPTTRGDFDPLVCRL